MKKYFLKSALLVPLLTAFLMGSIHKSVSAVSPSIDAEEIIRDIIAVVGLKPNFALKAANIPNAAAVTYNGKRYIAYNPGFIATLNAKAGNKWASVSILAHEIGHHLNGHTLLNSGSQPHLELEADEFSGFVLQKMGATLSQAQVAMKLAADYKPGLTHPGQQDRMSAIARGWDKAAGSLSDMAKYNKPAPPAAPATRYGQTGVSSPGTERNSGSSVKRTIPDMGQRTAVLDTRQILAQIDFPSDRSADYYVTTQFNLVKIMNRQLYFLGKMLPTNSPQYPFVLKHQGGTLFVDRSGKILTANKNLAGYLKMS